MTTLKKILFFRFVLPAVVGIILLYAAVMIFMNIRYKRNVLERFKQDLPMISRVVFSQNGMFRPMENRGRMHRPPEPWRRNIGMILRDPQGKVILRYPSGLDPQKVKKINEAPFKDMATGQTLDFYIVDNNFLTPLEAAFMRQLWLFTTGVVFLLSLLYLFSVVRFSRKILRQSHENAHEVSRLTQGDYDLHLQIPYEELAPFKDGLEKMAAELREQDRVKRSFMTNLSHDMKTPLTIIRGIVEGMKDQVLTPGKARYEELLEEVGLMDSYIDKIKRYDNAGVHTIGESLLRPSALSFQKRYRSLMEITLDIPEDFSVPLKDAELETVLDNLLTNAYRYNSKKKRRCRISAAAEEGRLRITVEDNGDGIAPGERERIFEKFYRGDKARHSQGTGLGLSLVKDIITASGGTIRAGGTARGSVFEIIY